MGRYLKQDFAAHRDELIISTKAGYTMWPGPYGDWGSQEVPASPAWTSPCSACGLDYVDIFYHHRPDPETPLEETLGALDQIVRQGKALYAGISNYRGPATIQAHGVLSALGTPLTIHQARYSMFDRWVEDDLIEHTGRLGVGVIVFSPLDQGLLTDKYLDGVPEGSRAAKPWTGYKADRITEEQLQRVRKLNKIAGRPRPDPGADGPLLGAARRAGDQRPGRRQPRGPDRGERGRRPPDGVQRRRAESHREGPGLRRTSLPSPRLTPSVARAMLDWRWGLSSISVHRGTSHVRRNGAAGVHQDGGHGVGGGSAGRGHGAGGAGRHGGGRAAAGRERQLPVAQAALRL